MTQRDVISDLTAAAEEFEGFVAGLDEDDWRLPTPAPGWTVAHQVAHLAFIFRLAGTAAAEPELFAAMAAKAAANFDAAMNAALDDYLGDPPEVLLSRWRAERDTAIKALAAVPADQLVPWLVRPLPPAVLACAGMMELFGHGQDIADALGITRTPADRLWHIALFATLTWDFGYQSRGLTPPDVQFRYELTAPSGAVWEFGPADAEQRITGPAEDFCLLVTRRRHRDDLALEAVGADADHWLDIAQAYRGPAGEGTRELPTEVVLRNELAAADLISIVFTVTPDLTSCFPAGAARELDLTDVPLLCATEVAVPGALPRVVRLLAHVESDRPRSAVRHVYLRGAGRLRPDLAA